MFGAKFGYPNKIKQEYLRSGESTGPPTIQEQAQGLGSQRGLDQPKGSSCLCQHLGSLCTLAGQERAATTGSLCSSCPAFTMPGAPSCGTETQAV